MRDSISREEAIEWVENWVDVNKYYHPYSKCNLIPIDEVIDRLQNVPSTEKTGKWIQNDNGTYSCSLCQSWIPKEQYYYARFCLHCGARMEE